jgi:16S rRNA (guanine527-N7)-methyltransferase
MSGTQGLADPSEVLRAGLQQLAVPDPKGVQTILERYLDELERWNPRFGLVKAADRRELVVKHALDSLSAWRTVREAAPSPGGSVLDVGSGAGFPGIPLAAALPDLSFTLLERGSRRASFLKTCGVLLGLPRLRVVTGELEGAEGDYDVVTFRAVAPFDRFLLQASGSRVRWRTVVAYKGREDRAWREIEEARRLAGASLRLRLVRIKAPSMEEERCLIVASKTETPGAGVPTP